MVSVPYVYKGFVPSYAYSYVVIHYQLCMPALTSHAFTFLSSAGAVSWFNAVSVDTLQY